ncbi:hypothetical protein GCK32_002435 [Trichostrongylus colubriformis]|uniref:Uncharacterized protein n=1 Tax=Trichostrongylus colubriformis TaxID=6319 RepID=A0AAN8EV53_TRICO
MVRFLLLFLSTCSATVVALLPDARQALIPITLRRRLCELTVKTSICDFNEVPAAPVDDENYSKWLICKYHPELLPCKWDPLKKIPIPIVHYEPQTLSTDDSSIDAEQPDFAGIDIFQNQATTFTKSTNEFKDPFKFNEIPISRGAQADNRSIQPLRTESVSGVKEARYDGKLSVENDLEAVGRHKQVASPEVEEFDENILMANGNIFGK